MNRKSFFKTLGAGILTAVFLPNKLFSKNEPKKIEENEVKKEPFQFIIINIKGKHEITPIRRGSWFEYFKGDNHVIEEATSLIRMQNLSGGGHCFGTLHHNDLKIETRSYFSASRFNSNILDIPIPLFVKNINEFKFDFKENDAILFTLFPQQKIVQRNLATPLSKYNAPSFPKYFDKHE